MVEGVHPAEGGYTVLGEHVAMPVKVRAAKTASATFIVRHADAQKVIEPTGLTAAKKRGDKAIVALALVDYLDNDLGCYKELALSVIVDDTEAAAPGAKKPPVSALIHRLPVSEEFTCAAGRGIWGFPKWVTDVDVRFTKQNASCVLREDGHEVVRINIDRGWIPLPRRPMPMNAFSYDEGVVRRTPWNTDGVGKRYLGFGGATVDVGYGHPLADELRTLGLPKRALMTIYDPMMCATFGEPSIADLSPR